MTEASAAGHSRSAESSGKPLTMLRPSRLIALVAAALLAGQALAGAQATPAAVTTLIVSGDVSTPLKLTGADLKAMPRTKVDVTSEGVAVTYEGVLVGEILKRAGSRSATTCVGPPSPGMSWPPPATDIRSCSHSASSRTA
jgi:hypothetical protein